jgi:hypothetical protein
MRLVPLWTRKAKQNQNHRVIDDVVGTPRRNWGTRHRVVHQPLYTLTIYHNIWHENAPISTGHCVFRPQTGRRFQRYAWHPFKKSQHCIFCHPLLLAVLAGRTASSFSARNSRRCQGDPDVAVLKVLSLPVNSNRACSAGVSGGLGVKGVVGMTRGFDSRGDIRLTGDDTRRDPGSGLKTRASFNGCLAVEANWTVARCSGSMSWHVHTGPDPSTGKNA